MSSLRSEQSQTENYFIYLKSHLYFQLIAIVELAVLTYSTLQEPRCLLPNSPYHIP